MPRTATLLLASLSLTACSAGVGDTGGGSATGGLAVLGGNTHSVDSVVMDVVADASDGLDVPRDVAFHPDYPGQLWILNRGGPSVTIVDAVGTDQRDAWVAEGGPQDCGGHFMAQPSALAFGDNGFLATSHETDIVTPCTNDAPDDFMGPTLWTSDPAVFEADWASHYDMLHDSPNAVGIAWETANVYWVYDGMHGSLTRYDFESDHGPGGADHSDGIVRRYVSGQMGYLPDVVSHLVYDPDTALLYAADAANDRVVVLDTTSGTEGNKIRPNYDDDDQREVDGADLWTLVDGADQDLVHPAGLAMVDGLLYVVDNGTGRITAFDLDGQVVDWLDTGLGDGALMGLTLDDQGRIYFADAVGDRVFRITPSPAATARRW